MSGSIPSLYSQLLPVQQGQIQYLENCVKSLNINGSNAEKIIQDIDAQISKMIKEDVWEKYAEPLRNVQNYLKGLKWTVENLSAGDDLNVDKEGLKLLIDRISQFTCETMCLNPGPAVKRILGAAAECAKQVHFRKDVNYLDEYIRLICGYSITSKDKDVIYKAFPNKVLYCLRAGMITASDDRLVSIWNNIEFHIKHGKEWERSLKGVICHLAHYGNINDCAVLANCSAVLHKFSDEWIYFLVEEAGLQFNTDLHASERSLGLDLAELRLFDHILSLQKAREKLSLPGRCFPFKALVLSGATASGNYLNLEIYTHTLETYCKFRPVREQVEKENERQGQVVALVPLQDEKVSRIVLGYLILDAKGMRKECESRLAASGHAN